MIFRRILAALALLCAAIVPAQAQKTKAQLNSEIGTNFPDNTTGLITPSILRTTNSDIVNSIMPTAPVVSGNLACFNGTTGLLQDCATAPGNFLNGTRTGNTSVFATASGTLTAGDCVKIDASGNLVDNGAGCGANSNTPHTQDFLAGGGFTPGVTTALTLSSAPTSTDLLIITFDGVWQNANTWSLAGAVVTFNAVIPLNTQVVEAKWSTSSTLAGVGSLTAGGTSVNGAINLVPGPGTSITAAGQNITIGNDLGLVSIMDPAYGTKCNAVITASGSFLSINSGSPNLLSNGSSFTSADVGKSIWVPGAGVAGAGLSTTILTFTDATHVVLNTNASTTITALAVTQANPLVYGTDDTASINAAIVATPPFGTLYINPITLSFPVRGCLIKQSGATGRSLLVDHPINILGGGNGSALITDPSMAGTIINIHALVSGVTWKGITWQGFLLGTDTNFTPMTRYGSYGIWFDATSAGPGGFTGIHLRNLSIGESATGFYSLVLDGVGTQGNRIDDNFIYGGIYLNQTADSNQITNNRLLGVSTFGIRIDTPTAGNFLFSGNSTTLAAGLCILNGSSLTISNNFFEEQTASGQYPHNAQVDIGCSSGQAMSSISLYGNIITAGLSSANNIKIDANAGFTYVYTNETATRLASIASITNANATTVCGPNQIITASPHLTGTAPVLWGVGAC